MTAAGGGGQPSSTEENRSQKREEHKETFRIIKEMSDILNTGLDVESLGFCLRLCEEGVNPVALAHLIKSWRENKNSKGTNEGRGGGKSSHSNSNNANTL